MAGTWTQQFATVYGNHCIARQTAARWTGCWGGCCLSVCTLSCAYLGNVNVIQDPLLQMSVRVAALLTSTAFQTATIYCNHWAPAYASAFINVKTKPGCKHSGTPLGNLLLLSACKQHQWHIVAEASEQEVNITGLWQWIFLLTGWIFNRYYLAFLAAYSMRINHLPLIHTGLIVTILLLFIHVGNHLNELCVLGVISLEFSLWGL